MTDRLGQQFGNYRITAKLGSGGFAEVYLGEHIYLGTQAALKIIQAQLAEEDVELFRVEARTVAALLHPHIVRILDFGVEEKTPFLVMDYASHGTLRQRHPRKSQVSLDMVVSYVKQISDALQYAHNKQIVHRDIKPENMLIGREGDIWLSDFGIALLTQSSHYQNQQNVVGTIAYMAPEQIQASAQPASDQYALGVVVYEWLTGENPFQGTMAEVIAKHLSAPLPSLREKMPNISMDVEEVVLTALAKEPEQRFSTVKAFATALRLAAQTSYQENLPSTQSDETMLLSSSAEPQIPAQSDEAALLAQPDEELFLTQPMEHPPVAPPVENVPIPQPSVGQPSHQDAVSVFADTVSGAPEVAPETVPVAYTPIPPPPPGYSSTPLPSPAYPYVSQSQPSWPVPSHQTGKPVVPAKTRRLRILVAVILGLIVLGGIVGTIIVTRPPSPSIGISSSYHGSIGLGGPADTVLHINGTGFSHNSAIMFLLDDLPAPGAPSVQSDSSGNFQADVTITDSWLIATHKFSAQDAAGYKAQSVAQITVMPQPVMQVTSKYHQGSTLVGASGTMFTIAGRRFSPNAQITLIMDNLPLIVSNSSMQSDAMGHFQTYLPVTSTWTLGEHTLAAKDGKGYGTEQGQALSIVSPGVADTPGSNGSPADDATFQVYASGYATDTDGQSYTISRNLSVTGRPDPEGGSVCSSLDGSSHTYHGTLYNINLGYTETVVYACSGTYKSGRLTYTETATSDTFTLGDGEYCPSPGPYVIAQLKGTFKNATEIQGTYHRSYFRTNCSGGRYVFRGAADSSWSGYMF